jgi:hypothetical protein
MLFDNKKPSELRFMLEPSSEGLHEPEITGFV